ncbi:uncharacterized protein LAESUDRAFT_738371 [Laetiporus sulphureus 93-53]|uniref:Alpha/beta-hydrolase n=1 Tax=Laetiporus sulphureus 93-53 TaxID=1314785 RepID=A0A165CNX0_9APHY|nr:uncharacterized protein LAESUDRAFT_738371 [Laetiporus sulphureus 93-53]KZT03150.1 hypothetical protein LAESUDRAFT_738371 [Laetiporus sulphureus 93-53]
MPTKTSFPRPNGVPKTYGEGVPIPLLLPIAEPPPDAHFPARKLPEPTIVAGFRRTSHVIPAAYLRSLPNESPLRDRATSGEPFDVKAMARKLVEARLEFESEDMQKKFKGASRVVMWNCVDRFVPVTPVSGGRGRGLTLFLTHATGSPRQIWEPAIAHLITNARASSIAIEEIWSFESVQHGDSALLNEQGLRDVSIANPALFDKLILIEPMIVPPSFTRGKGLDLLLKAALSKPEKWPSRKHVKESLLRSPAMKTWDPEVVDVFAEHGVVECDKPNSSRPGQTSDGERAVRLKTRPFDEAVVYCEWNVCYEAWTGLKDLDPRIHLHWIMSARTNATTGGEDVTRETVWRRVRNTTNVRLPEVGHLAVQEAPKAVATAILDALVRKETKHTL